MTAKEFIDSKLTPEQRKALWADFHGASDSPLDYSWAFLPPSGGNPRCPQASRDGYTIRWSFERSVWLYG